MSVIDLARVVYEQTVAYRKGEVVTEKPSEDGVLHVIVVDDFAVTPKRGVLVDVHFINVGFTEASADREGFLAALKGALGQGEFVSIDADRLAGGPSYIEVGGWLGSQQAALQFFGLCEHHGLGKVIIPATLGICDEQADQMAGAGMIFCPIAPEHLA